MNTDKINQILKLANALTTQCEKLAQAIADLSGASGTTGGGKCDPASGIVERIKGKIEEQNKEEALKAEIAEKAAHEAYCRRLQNTACTWGVVPLIT